MTQLFDLSTAVTNLTIIDSIRLDTLLPAQSQSPQFSLYTDSKKSHKIEAYWVVLPKEKLLNHLHIYQWRCKTEFPIVKTKSISIRNQQPKSAELIEVQILNQHCPIRLSDNLQLNVGQALYLLKQSLIGFERLFDRFGGFEISDHMIAINERGHCRVWLNQNYSLNRFPKSIVCEKNMLDSIITIIQSHVSDSKNSRKFFGGLKTCHSFLEALKAIDIFIKKSRVLVPKKISSPNFSKVFPGLLEKFRLSRRSKASQTPLIRFSIKSSIPKKSSELQNYLSKSPKKDYSPSPSKIKRFKSQNRLLLPSVMKTSQGETAYSRSIREIKTSNAGLSAQSPHSGSMTTKAMSPLLPKPKTSKERKWIEDSSFIMGGEQGLNPFENKKQCKQKKELSHSQAFKQPYSSLRDIAARKYSVNTAIKFNKNHTKTQNTNPEHDQYFAQFSSLLNQESQENPHCEVDEEEQEEQMQLEHLNKILKNNGWNMKGLMENENQLKKSFHAQDSQKNTPVVREQHFRLEKLGSMGRRQMAMSILPEEMQDL